MLQGGDEERENKQEKNECKEDIGKEANKLTKEETEEASEPKMEEKREKHMEKEREENMKEKGEKMSWSPKCRPLLKLVWMGKQVNVSGLALHYCTIKFALFKTMLSGGVNI